MIEIPVALIENEPPATKRFARIINRAETLLSEERGLPIRISLVEASDLYSGLDLASSGVFPIIVADLGLPDPMNRFDGPGTRNTYPGIAIIDAARNANKDVLTAAWTAFGNETHQDLFDMRIDAFLNKKGEDVDEKRNIPQFVSLVEEALSRFNYAVDIDVDAVLALAFGAAGAPDGFVREACEICLRRAMAGISTPVHYDSIGQGRSGAGLVAAYSEGFRPQILKLAPFSDLAAELRNYIDFIRDRIVRCSKLSADRLAQSGAFGLLAYSFEGDIAYPRTLGSAVQDMAVDIRRLASAIAEHFTDNCKLWYLSLQEYPCDIATACRQHYFGCDLEAIREEVFAAVPDDILDTASVHLASYLSGSPVTSAQAVHTITRAVLANHGRILCKKPTVAHGDLNVGNLIWNAEAGTLSMIDFAKTADNLPRMIDYTKLEASIKYHIPHPISSADELAPVLDQVLCTENSLIGTFQPKSFPGTDPLIVRKLQAISSVRRSALTQCGPRAEEEYFLCLLFVTAKHIGYSAKDLASAQSQNRAEDIPKASLSLIHAIASLYFLAAKVSNL